MEDYLIGLYYPYSTFKNDAWLKLAALYWDKLGRIAPRSGVFNDSDTVKQLCEELDFVKNFEPSSQDKYIVGQMFLEALSKYSSELVKFYGVKSSGGFSIGGWKVDTGFWYELNKAGLIWAQGHLDGQYNDSAWEQGHLNRQHHGVGPHDMVIEEVEQFGPKWRQSDISNVLAFIEDEGIEREMEESVFHIFHLQAPK
jgi:hypothetical protein